MSAGELATTNKKQADGAARNNVPIAHLAYNAPGGHLKVAECSIEYACGATPAPPPPPIPPSVLPTPSFPTSAPLTAQVTTTIKGASALLSWLQLHSSSTITNADCLGISMITVTKKRMILHKQYRPLKFRIAKSDRCAAPPIKSILECIKQKNPSK